MLRLLIYPSLVMDSMKNLILITARDISEEKRKEIDLIRFFNVAENSVNPLQITHLNGKMIYVNKAFEAASGYMVEELIGKNPRVFEAEKIQANFGIKYVGHYFQWQSVGW